MEYMQAGGSIMWMILFLSFIALAVVIERIIFFIGASADPERIEKEFELAVSRGDERAARAAASGKSSMHRLFTASWESWGMSPDEMRLLIDGRIRREIYRWEKNLSLLEITARVAPLLGLLGTVLGMVQMFETLNIGGAVNAKAVTGGIWKALFTTVAGLTVAIPAIIAHGILLGRISREEEKLERGGELLIALHAKREKDSTDK
jgi:biopolymer transport protein ExbB